MRKYYMAEKMKNRHTYVEKLMLLMPLITMCLTAGLMADYFIINYYNWWYIVLLPGMIAIICAAVGNRDKKMKNSPMLVLPADLGLVWDGKVLYGIRCMGITLIIFLLAILCFSIGAEQMRQSVFLIHLSVGENIQAIVVLFTTSLWQIPFCLFLQQMISTFPMLLIHIGSYSLLATGLSLSSFFMILPGGITARLMCIILKILPNGLIAESGSITFSPELLEWRSLPAGIASSLIWFFLLWMISRRWFIRQAER